MTQAEADTAAQILTKAEELFRYYGYAKTGVADIAQACGMSPANLYRFFKGKQAIAEAILRAYFAELRREMQQALAGPGPAAARLRAMLLLMSRRMIAETRQSPRIIELANICCPVPGENATDGGALADHIAAQTAIFAQLIAEGMRDGSLTSPAPTEDALLLCQTLATVMDPEQITRHGLADAETRAVSLIDFALRALRAKVA